ncbi:MAG: hypothetical protein JJ971_08235 [Balneolaceae bacterium]|nr:hypothetical protein [Balneolaceae bacterium]MBO6546774.1 hypothetical protein [Balneolaceae bacterium]MBO6649134.1 hypothetical protein [Balneolaceae bacterium]
MRESRIYRTFGLLALYLFLLSTSSFAQTISIPGVSGIEFDTTGGDYSISITDNFTVHGITVVPGSLTMTYSDADDSFELDGTVTASFDGEEIDAELDFLVSDEALQSVAFNVSADFTLKSLELSPSDLGFEWTGGSNFSIYGALTATLEGNEMEVSMGDADNPGVNIENGTISGLSMSVTGSFDIKTISISPEDLTFIYTSDDDQFEMYGDATTTIDGNEIDIALGDEDDPGLILDSGALTHINFGVTADFEMKGITISPDALTLEYDSPNTQFEFYGSVSVKFDGEEVDATLGDADDPGIVFDNGAITHVNFGLTADFEIKSLAVIPDNLTFEYDSGENHFEMYGNLTFKIGSDEVEAIMGDADDPGLIYKNNSIQHVNIGVTEDFSMSGLKIKTTDLGAEWNSGSDYHIYGDADLSIDNETIDVDFGTFNDPGIVVRNGSLHSFEVDVNSDLKFGNLEVTTKDVDIKYSSSKFEVTGEVEIDEVFSLSVTLGSGDQAGLEIDVSGSEPSFKIEALTIDIEHADLGAIDLKKFELAFNSSGITESEVDVVFPSGTDIDAIIKFKGNPATIDEISITYTADNLEEALELFEGIQIAEMSGTVGNLSNTSNLFIDADITTIFGGGFTLAGEDVTLLEMYDAVSIDADEFTMSGDVNVGAYKNTGGDWKSLLGSGSFFLDVVFQNFTKTETINIFGQKQTFNVTKTPSVFAEVNIKIPSDPLVEAEAFAYLNSNGDFDALVDVTFYVPHSIPIIGGDKLGSVDGAIRYKYNDLGDSYAAGWTRIKTFWHTYHLGAKYKFKSRSISTFSSSSTISDIESDINSDLNSKALANNPSYVNSTHIFEVYDAPVSPSMLLVQTDWENTIDSVLITVIGPEGIYELTKVTTLSDTNTTTVPEFSYEENMQWVLDDTAAVFVLTTPSAFSEEEIAHATLLEGRYQVVVSMPSDQAPDSVFIDIQGIYQAPMIDLEVSKNTNDYELTTNYWSLVPDSSHISYYVNGELITHVEAENFDEFGYGSETYTYSPDVIAEEDTLIFYALIDDSFNPPQSSNIIDDIIHAPDFYGTISFPESADSLKSGLRIFIDEDVDGSFDVASTGGLELFNVTGQDGGFAINGLEDGTYEVRIVLPPGYRIMGGTDRKSHTEITFDGTPIELDIEIEAYSEIE